MKYYTTQHEWVEVKDGVGTVGISAHAAEELGDITFVELPEPGMTVKQGDVLLTVESVKAAADVYAPVGGCVEESNDALAEAPEKVNDAAETDGWLCRISGVDESELNSLMDEAAYQTFLND